MKLYHLNPNDYGEEYFVLAESKEHAFELILEKLDKNCTLATCTWDTLPRKYTLDEYNYGEVIRSEIA